MNTAMPQWAVKVIVAEDDPDDQFLIQEALKETGLRAQVTCVEDGEALLERLRHGDRPDLILLDLNMPRMDGRQTLRVLKQEPEFQNIPVFVFTTSTFREDIDYSYGNGAASFITKPSSFPDLVETIHSLFMTRFMGKVDRDPSGEDRPGIRTS
jgi:CheY-like chemotaxis protein